MPPAREAVTVDDLAALVPDGARRTLDEGDEGDEGDMPMALALLKPGVRAC